MENKIKVFRESKNLSMKEFSHTIGISRQALFRIEKNLNNPSIKTLNKIKNQYGGVLEDYE